jgi:site-specific recombinase XerD
MAGLPLSQALDEYLAWLELDRHASTGTVEGYRGDLRRFSDFAGGDAGIPDIAELDRDILRGYQRHLTRLRTGPKGARRPLAISTRSRRLVALRSFLRFAAREEWLPGDLGTTIDVPKLPERLPTPRAHRPGDGQGADRGRGVPPLARRPLPRPSPAQHVCRQLAQRLGIPAFHPHQLRHTLGTLLQETMGDARLTAETLGHRGLGSVSGYTKITDQRRREAYEQMQRRGL